MQNFGPEVCVGGLKRQKSCFFFLEVWPESLRFWGVSMQEVYLTVTLTPLVGVSLGYQGFVQRKTFFFL